MTEYSCLSSTTSSRSKAAESCEESPLDEVLTDPETGDTVATRPTVERGGGRRRPGEPSTEAESRGRRADAEADGRPRSAEEAADIDARGRPARGVPRRPAREGGRLVRRAHLLRHGEPGEGQPGEPDHLAEHGDLHPRGGRAHRGGRRDQERPAQAGQAHRPARLRPGPDGPDRRVLVRRTPHAVGDRLRRPQPPAGAAEPRGGREHARPRRPGPRPRPPRRRSPAAAPRPRPPRASRSRSPTSTSPTRSWSSTARSPRCTRRSPRSTPRARGSRPSSRSSAGRPRSS